MNMRLLSLVSALTILCGVHAEAKGPVYSAPVTQTYHFTSAPAGAKVYYLGRLVCASTHGSASITAKGVITPASKKELPAALRRAAYDSRLTFTFVKEGYQNQEVEVEPTITQVKKSFLFDWPSTIACEMQRDPSVQSIYDQDSTIPQGAATEVVTRDNPGTTSLERTVIRWYFESQPQGARIFWRVISSCPDQVKNTNELWLGNTPFEETRSFNIQGLTYENSRDVQIEIKVRRNGYLDQTKRFNVRQAIDQQEISSFFDMVKNEE